MSTFKKVSIAVLAVIVAAAIAVACIFIFKKGKNGGTAAADKRCAAISTEFLKNHFQKGELYEKSFLQIVA